MAEIEKVVRGLECCCEQHGGPELCEQCPYTNEPFPCGNAIMRDALALLKEQMPRVMTLEEAREAIRDGGEDVIFWEEKTSLNPHVLGIGLRMIDSEEIVFPNNDYVTFDALDDQKVVSEYGSLFRLWSSRPSAEMMENTPWEGDAE